MRACLALVLGLFFSFANASAPSSVLIKALKHHHYADVLPAKYQHGKIHVLDISKNNKDFAKVDVYSTRALVKHSLKVRQKTGADLIIGRYMEDRNIYKRGEHYGQDNEERTVHLGLDLMVPAGTDVFSPLPGKVHSFKDNAIKADYGPTIILEHRLDGITFYTLYGHLSRASLKHLKVGQTIKAHQRIATVGTPDVNGGWPTHLHFQIIDDMKSEKGNFIGVVAPKDANAYRIHCPDPNLILRIDALS